MVLKYVDDLTMVDENISVNQQSTIQFDLDNGPLKIKWIWTLPSACLWTSPLWRNHQFYPPPHPHFACVGRIFKVRRWLKFLGYWDIHIADVTKCASGRLFMLSMLKCHGLSVKDLVTVCIGFICPLLEYTPRVNGEATSCARVYPEEGV